MDAKPEEASQCPRPLSCWASLWMLRLMEARPEDASQCPRPFKLLCFIMEDEAHGGQV